MLVRFNVTNCKSFSAIKANEFYSPCNVELNVSRSFEMMTFDNVAKTKTLFLKRKSGSFVAIHTV